MKEIKHFTMSVMFACIIFSLFLTRGIPYFTDELIVLIIICIFTLYLITIDTKFSFLDNVRFIKYFIVKGEASLS